MAAVDASPADAALASAGRQNDGRGSREENEEEEDDDDACLFDENACLFDDTSCASVEIGLTGEGERGADCAVGENVSSPVSRTTWVGGDSEAASMEKRR